MPKSGSPGQASPGNGPDQLTNGQALQLLHGIQRTLLGIDQQLNSYSQDKKEKDMALTPEIAAVISQIDNATNAIAARIQAFIDAANAAGNVSAAEVVAALQPEADRLSALGSNPEQPVPPQG